MAAAASSSALVTGTSLLPCVSTMQLGQTRKASAVAESGVAVQFDSDFATTMDYVMACHYYKACGPGLQPGVVAAMSSGEVVLAAITPAGLAPVAMVSDDAMILNLRCEIHQRCGPLSASSVALAWICACADARTCFGGRRRENTP